MWEGTLGNEKVCVKVLRVYNPHANNQKRVLAVCGIRGFLCTQSPLTLYKPFYGEAVVWKRLRHPNVVPFLGITTAPLQFVSVWMPNGTLTEYVNVKPQVDRISIVSISSRHIVS